MKLLKYLIFAALGFVALLFVVGIFMDDEEVTNDSETEEVVTKSDQKKKKKHVESDDDSDVKSNGSWGDGKVKSISQSQFKTLVANYSSNKKKFIGEGPVVVDCYATWCGPCKALSPVLDKVAKKYKGQVQFYKLDVDQCGAVSSAYGINSIPFLMFCSNGKIETVNGAPSQSELEDLVEEMLE